MKNSKSIIFICLTVLLMCTQACASDPSSSKLSDSWREFGESAKDAGKSLGSAMSETGKRVADITYFGTWVFTSGKTVTTIKIDEEKNMEISQATPGGTDFWRGTCNGAVTLLTFKITESGNTSKGNTTTKADKKTWRITYSVKEKDGIMKVKCSNIPTTEDGHNFSEETIFTLQQ